MSATLRIGFAHSNLVRCSRAGCMRLLAACTDLPARLCRARACRTPPVRGEGMLPPVVGSDIQRSLTHLPARLSRTTGTTLYGRCRQGVRIRPLDVRRTAPRSTRSRDAPDHLALADAQPVIPRGYGFASWSALKRTIESLTTTPVGQFLSALHAGDVDRVRTLTEAHADVRAAINEPISRFNSRPVARAPRRTCRSWMCCCPTAPISA
jgi:hypothetical protein